MLRVCLVPINQAYQNEGTSQGFCNSLTDVSAMSGTSLASLLTQLKKAYDAKSSTIAAKGKQPQMTTSSAPVSAILVQAKISLAQSGLLLPGTSTSQSKSDLQYAREILSYGALLSLQNGDVAGFERFLAQIKPFWDPSLQWVSYLHRAVPNV